LLFVKVIGFVPSVIVTEKAVSQAAEGEIELIPLTLNRESSTLNVALAVPPTPLQDAWKSVAFSSEVAAAARRKTVRMCFMVNVLLGKSRGDAITVL
jgi:hypothetical protein